MKETTITIQRFEFSLNNEIYYVFMYQSKENMTEFTIKRARVGFSLFCIGLNLEDINCSPQKFMQEHVIEWVTDYEEQLSALEHALSF